MASSTSTTASPKLSTAAPEVVAAYLARRAGTGLSPSSLRMDAAAIRHAHHSAGHASPTASEGVKAVLAGLVRMDAVKGRTVRQAAALTLVGLAAIRATAHLPRTGPTGRTESPLQAVHRGRIDVALASVAFDAMLRRSEAAALRWADIEFRPDGSARLTVRRSKTDTTGEGAVLYLSRASAKALRQCRALTDTGPESRVFAVRSGRTVSRRLAAMGRAAGIDGLTGHSPRVGAARALVGAGEGVPAVQVAGRWKAPTMPARYAAGELAGRGAVARLHGEA